MPGGRVMYNITSYWGDITHNHWSNSDGVRYVHSKGLVYATQYHVKL